MSYLELKKSKKLLYSAVCSILFLSLSGCTGGNSSAAPYGGQCQQIVDALADTAGAIVVPGAANFPSSPEMDATNLMQQKVLEAGFENIAAWMLQVGTVHPYLEKLDTSAMTPEESQNIEFLITALSAGEIGKAVVIGDQSWYNETYEAVMSLGGACDA
jgi:hypothetical protein